MKQTDSTQPRMLIVWSWLPSNHSGAGILMRRLFAEYPPDKLWALTSQQTARNLEPENPIPPPERQITVPQVLIPRRWIDRIGHVLNQLLIVWTVYRGVKLVRREKIEALFAVPWDQFTIAAYFIHRFTGVPIYMYVMDDPAGTRNALGLQPLFYSLFMPRLLHSCRRVWGVSDEMCSYFEQRYAVKCFPLLPLLDLDKFQQARKEQVESASGGPFRVVFTGAVYNAQVDALRRLVRVVSRTPETNKDGHRPIQLTLYTSTSRATLEREKLMGENVRWDQVDHNDMPKALAQADVAFLPLSFDPKMRHIVETSLPSKLAEYLAAGVPILAHAPSYSTVAGYCRKYNCGLVVDQSNDELLRAALVRLVTDAGLRETLSARALETARQNHDARRIAEDWLSQFV